MELCGGIPLRHTVGPRRVFHERRDRFRRGGDPFGNGNEWPDSQVTKRENELVNNNTYERTHNGSGGGAEMFSE